MMDSVSSMTSINIRFLVIWQAALTGRERFSHHLLRGGVRLAGLSIPGLILCFVVL